MAESQGDSMGLLAAYLGTRAGCLLSRVCRHGLRPVTVHAGASLLCSLIDSCMVLRWPSGATLMGGGPCIMLKQQGVCQTSTGLMAHLTHGMVAGERLVTACWHNELLVPSSPLRCD